jgi:hypothetical protein
MRLPFRHATSQDRLMISGLISRMKLSGMPNGDWTSKHAPVSDMLRMMHSTPIAVPNIMEPPLKVLSLGAREGFSTGELGLRKSVVLILRQNNFAVRAFQNHLRKTRSSSVRKLNGWGQFPCRAPNAGRSRAQDRCPRANFQLPLHSKPQNTPPDKII